MPEHVSLVKRCVFHPVPSDTQRGLHLLDLLLNIVGIQEVFTGKDMTITKGLAITVEVETFLGLNDDLNVFDLLHGDLDHWWAMHIPVRVSFIDLDGLQIQMPAGVLRLLRRFIDVGLGSNAGQYRHVATFWIELSRDIASLLTDTSMGMTAQVSSM
jgi:hypothetical protein